MAPTSPTRSAAFFDLDKTVIARSSALMFTRHFYDGGLLTRRGMLRAGIAQLHFLMASAGEDQVAKLRKHITDMCAGWDVETVHAIVAETLDEVVRPVIFTEAEALIAQHKAAGRDVVLISASGREMVEPIGELLGVDAVRATEMEIVDGTYTGVIDVYRFGEQKAEAMRALAAERGYDLDDCYAYSDSSTDLPMLSLAGHPAVVNPDKALRAVAVERGWEVLDFDNPAPMVDWPSSATVGRTALAAAGLGAVAAVAVACGMQHRRTSRHAAA